jgi:glutathione S-transferase
VESAAVLYYSRNPNPRLAAAVARHLNAPVRLDWASPFSPGQAERFLRLNPNQSIPILVENGLPLWEADAIACRLSQMTGSEFWRTGAELPDMIRWISWGKERFVRACDIVHFERGTKQRYGHGPVDPAKVDEGLAMFRSSAAILDAHLAGREWLLGTGISYADFRMASFLPFNAAARLPVAEFPSVAAWNARLTAIPAWADPFQGLETPDLPPVPAQA